MLLSALGFFNTFAATRLITHAIRAQRGPFRNVSVGGRHVHHLTFGIFGLLFCGFLWANEIGMGEGRGSSPRLAGHLPALRGRSRADTRRVRPMAEPRGRLLDEPGPREHRRSRPVRKRVDGLRPRSRSNPRGLAVAGPARPRAPIVGHGIEIARVAPAGAASLGVVRARVRAARLLAPRRACGSRTPARPIHSPKARASVPAVAADRRRQPGAVASSVGPMLARGPEAVGDGS